MVPNYFLNLKFFYSILCCGSLHMLILASHWLHSWWQSGYIRFQFHVLTPTIQKDRERPCSIILGKTFKVCTGLSTIAMAKCMWFPCGLDQSCKVNMVPAWLRPIILILRNPQFLRRVRPLQTTRLYIMVFLKNMNFSFPSILPSTHKQIIDSY